jgi:hypothetical protein
VSENQVYLRPLPIGTTEIASRSAAERKARECCGRPRTGKLTAFAVLATDNDLEQRQPDGTMRREIVNRPVWAVIYPKTRFQGFMEGWVIYVDGRTGKFLMGGNFF